MTDHAQEGMDSIYGREPSSELLRDAVVKANVIRIDPL